MVRINIINPKYLADQHLIAEYDEILMLLGYVRKYPNNQGIPEKYTLGKGHIKFFKNKLLYLKNRHELIKKEMKKRKFNPLISIDLKEFDNALVNDWQPVKEDLEIIKNRLKQKINMKPTFYRYIGEKKPKQFFIDLIDKGTI